MYYSTFITEAKKLTIRQADNGIWYLDPEWKDIVCRLCTDKINELNNSFIENWHDVEDILKLEVERLNIKDSKKPYIINWLHDLISATVEPAMLEEENDFIKNLTAYMAASHAKDLNPKESKPVRKSRKKADKLPETI